MKRKSGVLLHPSSFYGKYPIGDLGYEAYKFIDIISDVGFSLWQVLPLNPIGWGGSPYMSPSSLSFDTNLISPELLLKDGFIDSVDEISGNFERVDFQKAEEFKTNLIVQSYKYVHENKINSVLNNFNEFKKEFKDFNKIALFFIIAKNYGFEWNSWPKDLDIEKIKSENIDEIDTYIYGQFLFYVQWTNLKNYANKKGIEIIGDIPIYVSYNSSDVWLNPDVFDLNIKTKRPNKVAGVPPDYFSETGQLWGNPLYKWFDKSKKLNKNVLDWWENRFKVLNKLYDIVRIDHFRAFESYWGVKYGEQTAINGKWYKGPGKKFFDEIKKRVKDLNLIAEDLGELTPEVEQLRDELNIPGMKILQFAMSGPDNKYLPSNFDNNNCVVYTGTHDNNTTKGWIKNDATENEKHFIWLYTRREYNYDNISRLFIELAFSSNAKFAIIPICDILNLDADARINTPSLADSKNWSWRLYSGALEDIDKNYFNELHWVYNR